MKKRTIKVVLRVPPIVSVFVTVMLIFPLGSGLGGGVYFICRRRAAGVAHTEVAKTDQLGLGAGLKLPLEVLSRFVPLRRSQPSQVPSDCFFIRTMGYELELSTTGGVAMTGTP
jgi:hypothetical protein